MKLKPYQWNSIIVGSWNRAILTPQGIAVLLFDKPKDTPIEVMVSLDGIGPMRVNVDDLIVINEPGRLIIEAKNPDWTLFDKSRAIAIKAIETLPRTPLVAAGFNVRYRLEDASEDFPHSLETKLDNNLSQASIRILSREMRRSLEFADGNINFDVSEIDASNYNITLNFNKTSSEQDALIKWLKIEMSEVKNRTENIIYDVLKISKENAE